MQADILIVNGEVYDGVHTDAQKLDIAVKDGRIIAMEKELDRNTATRVIDAKGLWISPGFIDSHASEGYSYLRDKATDHKLHQGVTTELFGNCGYSPAPVLDGIHDEISALADKIGFNFDWRDLGSYFDRITQNGGTPINVATLVGHNTLRGGVAKDVLNITKPEIDIMATELYAAIKQGAFGVSSGLVYTPGCYANTDELVHLAKTAKVLGGFYASHIRNERDKLEEAVEEALYIGQEAQIPVLVSHLKAAEQKNWGKIPKIIDMIEEFRDKNKHKASFDVYPYTAVSTRLKASIPAELLANGSEVLRETMLQPEIRAQVATHLQERGTDLSQMLPLNPDAEEGDLPSIQALAERAGITPYEQVCNLLQENPESWMVYTCMSESDMDTAVLWPDSMICSDSWSYPVNAATNIGDPHPRTYGAFSHYLDVYSFSTGRLSYGEAVRKITSVPARFMGLAKRGELRPGFFADIVLMNPETFSDNATYTQPRQYSDGVDYLLINGQLAIDNGEIVKRTHGSVLRHQA